MRGATLIDVRVSGWFEESLELDNLRPVQCNGAVNPVQLRLWWLALLSGLTLALTLRPRVACSQQFEVEGTLRSHPDLRNVGGQPATHFRVSVDGDRWFMRLTGETRHLYDYRDASYDGI